MKPLIRPFIPKDWSAVREIYHLGVLTRNATFETEVPEYEVWKNRFHPHLLWVALLNEEIIGWAGLQPISIRKVYEGVVEVTIYIHPDQGGRGVGLALMSHLIAESERSGIYTLYSSIFPENKASISLHKKVGFREIGYREKIAQLDGRWRNTILFERRSIIVGI